jgi:hypothetical protein
VAVRPFALFVTETIVPNGSVLWAQVPAWKSYQLASPSSLGRGRAVVVVAGRRVVDVVGLGRGFGDVDLVDVDGAGALAASDAADATTWRRVDDVELETAGRGRFPVVDVSSTTSSEVVVSASGGAAVSSSATAVAGAAAATPISCG